MVQAYEKLKAQVRAYVEHPFHVIKNIFKYKKVRYKGLAKNDTQLNMLVALGNLYMVRGELRTQWVTRRKERQKMPRKWLKREVNGRDCREIRRISCSANKKTSATPALNQKLN